MDQNNISLSSYNVVVHFIRFNLQFTDKSKIQEVAQYLYDEYSCTSFFKDNRTGKFYPLIKKRPVSCKAKFVTSHTKYWNGTRLEFEGGAASTFYPMIKENPLNWERMHLDSTNLGRIDLYYDRPFKESDRVEDYEIFLSDAAKTISSQNPSIKVELKFQSLAIGDRKTSPNYFRIYKRPNGRYIRFELEISLEAVKKLQSFLFAGQFETLESKLIEHYYSYIITHFEIDRSCYTDWVVENFRTIRFLQIPNNSLVATYINNKIGITHQEFVFKLFQLLSFIRKLPYSYNLIGQQEYILVSFKLTDFLQFTGTNNNHYQVQKVGKFLTSLQSLPPMLSMISNICFQSINIFPYLRVFKKRSWYVEFAVAEELYFYKYPFYFPEVFLNYQDKYQRQVQINFFLVFSVTEIEKVFDVEEFLEQFDISNSNLRKVKFSLIKIFVLAKDSKLIENEFVLILKNNQVKNVTKLTTHLISRTKLIHFKEVINL